ncbi:MAG: hypothetical protein HQ488_03770 [Parcubacteria group bacterium]|nr:hypothetical protein [Parcubacteria group bacterium]
MTAEAIEVFDASALVRGLEGQMLDGWIRFVALQALMPDDALLGVNQITPIQKLLPYCVAGSRLDQLMLARLMDPRPFIHTNWGRTEEVEPQLLWWSFYNHSPKASDCKAYVQKQLLGSQAPFDFWVHVLRNLESDDPIITRVWAKLLSTAETFGNWYWVWERSTVKCHREMAIWHMRLVPVRHDELSMVTRSKVSRIKALGLRRLVQEFPDYTETQVQLMRDLPSEEGRRRAWGHVELSERSLRDLELMWCWLKDCPDAYPREDIVQEILGRKLSFEEWMTLSKNTSFTKADVEFQRMVVHQLMSRAVSHEEWKRVSGLLYTSFNDEREKIYSSLCTSATTFEQWSALEIMFRPKRDEDSSKFHQRAQATMIRLGDRKQWLARLKHWAPTPFDTENIIRLCPTLNELVEAWKPYEHATTSFHRHEASVRHGEALLRAIADHIGKMGEPLTPEQFLELAPWPCPRKVVPLQRRA